MNLQNKKTRQQNVFYSLIQNWSDAEEAVEACGSATGELSDSYAIWLDSIEGRVDQLSTSWESFLNNIMDSSIIKGVVSAVTGLVNGLDNLAQSGVVIQSILTILIDALLPQIISLVTKLGTAVKSNVGGILSVLVAASTVLNMFDNVPDWLQALVPIISIVVTAIVAAIKLIATNLKGAAAQTSSIIAVVGTILTLITMVGSTCGTTGEGIATVLSFVVAAVIAAIFAIQVAIKGFEASNPLGWILAAISAIVVGITSLVSWIKDLNPSFEDLKETAEEAKEEWEDAKSELEEYEDEIEELTEKIKELREAKEAAGNVSIYDAEITALQTELDRLETTELAEQQATVISAYADSVKAVTDALAKYNDEYKDEYNLGDISSMTSEDLAKVISEYSELLDGYEYGENSLLDPYFEQYYKMLSKYAAANSSSFTETITKVLSIAGFEDAETNLKKFANSFEKVADITVDSVKAMLDDEELKEYLEYLEEIGAWDGESWDGIVEAIQSLHTSLVKLSRVDIADDIETLSDKFDALADALDDVADSGVIALDTLETLLESYPSLLEKYFTKSIDGYVLNSDYSDLSNYDILKDMAITDLQTYVDALVDAQTALSKLTEEDVEYETALYNVAVAQDNLSDKELEWATLLRETAIDEETDRLEAEQDALEDQLDAYQDLIDIRKELLETYQDEVDYQKELASKQKSVSQLSTQLALAKLDTSAAGQARVRELQADLDEAQEELDDYTLEHAIDVITEQLDAESDAYEKWINKEIEKIDNIITYLSTTLTGILTDTGITLEDGTVESLASLLAQATANDKSDMAQLYNDLNNSDVSTDNTTAFQSAYSSAISSGDYQAADSLYSAAKTDYDNSTTTEEEEEDDGYTAAQKAMANNMRLLIGSSASGMKANNKGDNGEVSYHGNTYKVQEGAMPSDLTDMYVAAYNIRGSDDGFKDRSVFAYNDGLYAMCDGSVLKLEGRATSKKGYNNLYSEWVNNGTYHTGGFVGGLESNEEFAKLLKGEFVSTPAQMDRFINQTLPALTNYSSGGATYNAPLISIECGSVTQDTLPDLETMVDEAVKKIQKQIDSGLSRNGYKRTVGKFSSTS